MENLSLSAKHHLGYRTWDYGSGFEKIKRLVGEGDFLSKNVLDLGCGDGRVSAEMVRLGANVIGYDVDPVALDLARKNGLDGRVADLEIELGIDSSTMDLVLCLDTMEHIYNEDGLVCEMARVLKPEGRVVISIPNHFDIRNRLSFLFGGSIIHWAHKKYEGTTVWDYSHVRFPRLVDLRELLLKHGLGIEAVQVNFNSGGVVPRRLTPSWLRRWLVATWPNLFSGKFVVLAKKGKVDKVRKIVLDRTLAGI